MPGEHIEYTCRADGADTAVVFIHGILGSPSQFTYLIDRLNGRYTIENLLLPGHGGTVRDFARSGMARWQAYVNARIEALEKEYDNIILVGHSMGCLLSVQAALTCPKRIRGLFLLAVPLVIRVKSPAVVSRMTSALGGTGNAEPDGYREAAEHGNSVGAMQPYKYIAALPRFVELFIKSLKTRRLLGDISVPLFVIHSEHDETVGVRSLRYLEQLPNAAVMIAKDSGHFYYPKEAKELIADALVRFIDRSCETETAVKRAVTLN